MTGRDSDTYDTFELTIFLFWSISYNAYVVRQTLVTKRAMTPAAQPPAFIACFDATLLRNKELELEA